MQDSTYRHRQVWIDWLRAQDDAPQDLGEIEFTRTLDTVLAPGSVAERRLVVDSVGDDGYHAFLLATYRGDELVSAVLDDDEGHVAVLHAGS